MADPQPFRFVELHARNRPSALALSTAQRDYTFEDLRDYATAIAGVLRRRGVAPGDVVLSQLRPDLGLLFLEAVFHEAAVWSSAPSSGLEGAGPFDWLLAHEAVNTVPEARTIVVDDEFMQEVANSAHTDAPLVYPSFDSVCRVAYTSGTTGRPLAVAGTVARQGRLPSPWLEGWPFFSLIQGFSGSGVKTACSCVHLGETYICPGEAADNVALARRNFVATLQGSPAQLAEFLALVEQQSPGTLDIDTVQCIGGFLPASLVDRVHRTLGATVTALYGSSEVGMVAMRRNVTDRPSVVGRPLPGVTIEVVDEARRPVAPGTEGDVRIRTDRRHVGYFGETGDAGQAVRDGWFYPGDRGRLVDDELELTGRAAEVINAGGSKFSPDVVESRVVDFAGVMDAAVVPAETADGLSSYAVLVVCDVTVDLYTLIEPLQRWCGGVAPASIFRVSSILRDENGKIQRAAMAEQLRSDPRARGAGAPTAGGITA